MDIWKKEDPRFLINKRADIVVLRPSLLGSCFTALMGSVETKNGWSIILECEDYKYISADDNWPQDWVWTWAP
jgi:hypothetical protein